MDQTAVGRHRRSGKIIWDRNSFIVLAQSPEQIGVTPYSAVLKSSDGVNWSYTKTVGTYYYIVDLLWNGKQYVGVGPSNGTPRPLIYTSADAVNWTMTVLSTTVANLEVIAWNGSRYIAGGWYGVSATSSDLTNWTVGTTSIRNGIKGIACDSVGFVAVGAEGFILTTNDGINWAQESSPTGERLEAIKNNGQGFIIVGSSGTILASKPNGNVTVTPTPTLTVTSTPTQRVTATPTPTLRRTPTPTQRGRVTVTPTPRIRMTPTRTRNFDPTPTSRRRAVTPTPTRGIGNYLVNYVIQSDWGNGATVNVIITNNSTTAVNGWTLAWTFSGNQTITNMWNATYTQSGTAVSVKDGGFNTNIPAGGGSVNFGFNLNYSGTNAKPIAFTLNGIACTVQ